MPLSDNVRSHSKQAQENLTALNNIIWGTCNTNIDADQCDQNMGWFAQSLREQCVEDMKDNNAIVLQTLNGRCYRFFTLGSPMAPRAVSDLETRRCSPWP